MVCTLSISFHGLCLLTVLDLDIDIWLDIAKLLFLTMEIIYNTKLFTSLFSVIFLAFWCCWDVCLLCLSWNNSETGFTWPWNLLVSQFSYSFWASENGGLFIKMAVILVQAHFFFKNPWITFENLHFRGKTIEMWLYPKHYGGHHIWSRLHTHRLDCYHVKACEEICK